MENLITAIHVYVFLSMLCLYSGSTSSRKSFRRRIKYHSSTPREFVCRENVLKEERGNTSPRDHINNCYCALKRDSKLWEYKINCVWSQTTKLK